LILGLDQGSIAAAGVAFADSLGFCMLYTKFDKVHRVIRDIRLAITHSCQGLFLKTQLFSSHIWGANSKPFGTGLFGDLKKRILNVFLDRHGVDSLLFRKYGRKIAADFNMPFGTDEQKTAVYKKVGTCPSFLGQMVTIKLGRWFSWNATAKDMMQEFNSTRMLLESFLSETDTAEEDSIAFDDLNADGRRSTPAAQLQVLRKAGGGLGLVYRLATDSLLECIKIFYVVTQSLRCSRACILILESGIAGGHILGYIHPRVSCIAEVLLELVYATIG
jgi:hypothetical protein